MVCFVSDIQKAEDNSMTDNIIDISEEHDVSDLKWQRIAGGSVIEYPPIFSPNGDILFIICDENIRAYSTNTGEWIRELEGIAGKKIIGQHLDPNNGKLLYGCTISGDVISWKWKSGVVNEKQALRFHARSNAVVSTFTLINMKDKQAHGLVSWRGSDSPDVQIGIFDLVNGFREEVKLPINLNSSQVKISVSQNDWFYFAVIQENQLHCVNYLEGCVKSWKNIKGIELTCVTCHPIEKLVATGDVTGRILIYREIFRDCLPLTTLYHWHHTQVNTVSFTFSGSGFYSGGLENTLVQWDLNNPVEPINFVPRMWGTPVHIAIGAENQKIAVAADDNGIQILNAQNIATAIIHNFTWIPNDKTEIPKFPIGLKVNPRTSSLVLNGRVGHLQFFSTHSKSLLFNLDTTVQNRLNIETEKVLYNVYVSHTALNMDWLATAELLDDQEHTVESRLKFWHFDLAKQTYVLNTQIELPHENCVRALEFSTPYSMEGLLCATSGEHDVKIWSLADSENINKTGKIWSCIARATYKDQPIKSLAFSSDTSLLGVGFGNTLCLYTSETLQLKCVLSAPSGLDGSTNKLTISLPTEKNKFDLPEKRQRFLEKRKKMLAAIRNLLEKDETAIIKNVSEKPSKSREKKSSVQIAELTIGEQEMLFNQILAFNSIDLFQKINIYDKFNLCGRAPLKWRRSYIEYCQQMDTETKNASILRRMLNLSSKHKFKLAYKYNQFKSRSPRNRQTLESFNRCISFVHPMNSKALPNGEIGNKESNSEIGNAFELTQQQQQLTRPYKQTVQINHVAFCTGEFAHLAIVCTENRLLVWNLLTLRLQSSLKLSVDKIVVDLYTSLVAVTTVNKDFYVFLPNTPIPLYQQKLQMKIHGLAWIPRRFPKAHSLTVDWQASTELYFLSEKQELLRLVSIDDTESLNTNTFYLGDIVQPIPYTPFAAMIAKQQNNYATADQDNRSTDTYSIGVLGKDSVKELTTLQSHTMAPVNLLCTRFLKSLLIDEQKKNKHNGKLHEEDSDSDSDDVKMNSDEDDD